jgi:SAM-dependent methyltransferase
MAQRFDRCDGVDISASMLEVAERYNRFPDRCIYRLNVRADLALFPDGTFTFIYSTIVLQHMEPQYSKAYIREFLRVLAPGGLLVFQVPGHVGPSEPIAEATRTPSAGRLATAAFQARLVAGQSAIAARAEEQLMVAVTVENRSPHPWPALGDANGRCQVKLANHWLHEDGRVLQRDDGRAALPHDVAPGARVELLLPVTAPRWDGNYWMEIDLVQEDVCWFAERGSPTARVGCVVTGGEAVPAVVVKSAEVRFSERHPGVFKVLRATGVRDAYWAWRRLLDRIYTRRDRLIIALREFGDPPLAPRIINWWRRRPFAPLMEMHCVPRAEVLAIVQQHGARVVNVEEELRPGGFQSYTYWISQR